MEQSNNLKVPNLIRKTPTVFPSGTYAGIGVVCIVFLICCCIIDVDSKWKTIGFLAISSLLVSSAILLLTHTRKASVSNEKRQEKYDAEHYRYEQERLDIERMNLHCADRWLRHQLEEETRENEHRRKLELTLLENQFELEQQRLKLENELQIAQAQCQVMESMISTFV